MSSFGSSTGNEPDPIMDEDLKSLDELRAGWKDMKAAADSLGNAATIEGVFQELNVVKQQLEMTHEQMRRLIGMYQTLAEAFKGFEEQRLRELQLKVAGGSTTPEDWDNGDSD
jgi:hypothetical protein